MNANDPIYSYSMHVVELPKRRVVHVVVQSTDLDCNRTVLFEKDFDLPGVEFRPSTWNEAMRQVLAEVEEWMFKAL